MVCLESRKFCQRARVWQAPSKVDLGTPATRKTLLSGFTRGWIKSLSKDFSL